MPAGNWRILCAEDDADTRQMAAALFGFEGYHITTAATIAEAFHLARSEGFDLYLLDNHFPDGPGAELIRRIRSFDNRTPIIVYSGSSTDEDMRDALDAGAQKYLVKPAGMSAINRAISELLEGHRE